MIAGVERVADRETRRPFPAEEAVGIRCHELLLEEGLVGRALADSLACSPPLVISEAEVDEACARFARGLDRLAGERRAGREAAAA